MFDGCGPFYSFIYLFFLTHVPKSNRPFRRAPTLATGKAFFSPTAKDRTLIIFIIAWANGGSKWVNAWLHELGSLCSPSTRWVWTTATRISAPSGSFSAGSITPLSHPRWKEAPGSPTGPERWMKEGCRCEKIRCCKSFSNRLEWIHTDTHYWINAPWLKFFHSTSECISNEGTNTSRSD